MPLFALVEFLEVAWAAAIGAMALAIPVTFWRTQRNLYRVLSLLAVPALMTIGTLSWLAATANLQRVPPLTSDWIVLIDNTRSMGDPDDYPDARAQERARKLGEAIQHKLAQDLPGRIETLEAERNVKDAERLEYWRKQQAELAAKTWRPSRLQLAQAHLTADWLEELRTKRRARIHVYHLDAKGRAVKLRDAHGDAGDIVEASDARQIERTANAIAQLAPVGNDSRLGAALRQVIDQHRLGPLTGVIALTDGVTTRDESILEAAPYAADHGVALYFVGLGAEPRELVLRDVQVDELIYRGDKAVLEFRVTSQGLGDIRVPLILKRKDKNGAEKEIHRETVRLDPTGRPVKVRWIDQPAEKGRHDYVIEAVPPEANANEKPIAPANLRVERTVEVRDDGPIHVLYVEGQPRNEFRFLKHLLERKPPDGNPRPIKLTVLLLDADEDWRKNDVRAEADNTAAVVATFPETLEELCRYNVLIVGDCNPNHPKLKGHLKNIASFVRGEDETGKAGRRPGGGLLFVAGAFHNPHQYSGTPLADVLPVIPLEKNPPTERPRVETYRPKLTPAGRAHAIFRFESDEKESLKTWQGLQPMYWHSSGYRIKPLAEGLVVHPNERSIGPRQWVWVDGKLREINEKDDDLHPLAAQMYLGAGRSLFFGFDETWRWRFREQAANFDSFWMRTIRHLARDATPRTELRLDRRTPYLVGDSIRVEFHRAYQWLDAKAVVEVAATYQPNGKKAPEFQFIKLAKAEKRPGVYEGELKLARAGKYRIWLAEPDLSATQPGGARPKLEAIVLHPPRETDRLPMDSAQMRQAAELTKGAFFTLADADQLLGMLAPR